MKLIISKKWGRRFRWLSGVIFMVIAFSSCSSNKEQSYAYMDDIYRPYSQQYDVPGKSNAGKGSGGVSDQDASIIKPYEPAVRDYWPYVKPLNFHMAFSFANYYNDPFGWGYNSYCRRYGLPIGYCNNYNVYGSLYGGFPPYFYNGYGYPYYGYPYYGDAGGGYAGGGGYYIFGNNVGFFKGINSTDKRTSYGVNYSRYSNYRVSGGSSSAENGRKSGSRGKNRYRSGYEPNKSNVNRRSNSGMERNYYQGGTTRSTGGSRSTSPTRSSGSGGGSYSGKRPR